MHKNMPKLGNPAVFEAGSSITWTPSSKAVVISHKGTVGKSHSAAGVSFPPKMGVQWDTFPSTVLSLSQGRSLG